MFLQSTSWGYMLPFYEGSLSILMNVAISEIYKTVFDKNRFNQVGVVVIDYNMPEMNGLDMIRALKKKGLIMKVIMLTGVADQSTAIKAFNDKEIDRFLVKGAADYNQKLIECIDELQLENFESKSLTISESVSNLNNPDFIELFNKTYKENNIIEYYLLDDSGSFLMYDMAGNPLWLIINTEEDIEMYKDLAQDEDEVSESVVNALEKREKIVILPNRDDVIPLANEWILKPAQKLKDTGIYYYGNPPLK
ncbi:MAG: response regulator [Gammaproteobacteria bacterium]